MAINYKVLGQSNPGMTTETTLYTVPSNTQAVVSTLTVCNQASSNTTFRIAVRPSGDGSTTAKHWIVYGATIAANDTTTLTLGMSLGAGDKIQIYAATSTMSFTAFGSEITS